MKKFSISVVLVVLVALSGCSDNNNDRTIFTVRIKNISDMSTLPSPLAPGVWVVHSVSQVLFHEGQPDAGMGLEGLAEDGEPDMLASNLAANPNVSSRGVFNTPTDSGGPGPLLPGSDGVYAFTFSAAPGDRLSFATMFVQSNDLFFAPSDSGISVFDASSKGITLFEGGKAISGDITDKIMLWDAGTEVNEEPGVGPNQAPRQAGPNTGPAENGVVQLVNDGYAYPPVNQLIQVTITP